MLQQTHVGGVTQCINEDATVAVNLRSVNLLKAVCPRPSIQGAHHFPSHHAPTHPSTPVNLCNVNLLQAGVPAQLAQHAAVATAHHQRAAGRAAQRARRQVRDHLLQQQQQAV